jgi:hypothetical protein
MAFKDIFKDSNEYNEKSIVGFASFAVMVVFAAADIITGFLGNAFVIVSMATTTSTGYEDS